MSSNYNPLADADADADAPSTYTHTHTHLIALLRELGALGHDHQAAQIVAACHCGYVVTFLPLLHDPLLN